MLPKGLFDRECILTDERSWAEVLAQDEDFGFKGKKKIPVEVKQRWREEAERLILGAQKSHVKVGNLHSFALQYARHVGVCLLLVKRRVKSWGAGFEKFVKREWPELSKSTRCNYMRVARYCKDPRYREARSIDDFLNRIGGKPKSKKREQETDEPTKEPTEKDRLDFERWEALEAVRKQINKELKRMTRTELKVLDESFDNIWPRWCEKLKEAVCHVMEDDLRYASREERAREERLKREVWARVTAALNRKRT
ncbi:MAG: hypothetical protein GXY83_41700 [Rhodopirellula sp.]|nr:hypothetical protein [Rhodopirellula sp.]